MTLAMALRRVGVDVRIVDRASGRTDKSKALVIWPRTLELLDIQGCVLSFLEAGHPIGEALRRIAAVSESEVPRPTRLSAFAPRVRPLGHILKPHVSAPR
jgi:2-polyprenyl-6-methoxyphenol hydroxylase-like FAD-dependent oxidoreductase